MPNIRILYQNQAKRAASVSSSSVAGSLVAANLLTDIKTQITRSTATAVQYTLTWTSAVALNMVGLAFTNLSSLSTIRAQVFSETADVVANTDSGTVSACAYAPLGQFSWGATPLGVNAYRFGGASYGRVYFPGTSGKKLVIDVNDATNASGFIECGCLITGAYWSPEANPEYGAELSVQYGANHIESEAGDLRTPNKAKRRAMDLSLQWLRTPADQLHMHEIMMQGMGTPLWVSLFPEDENPVLEQRHQMYCKLEGDTSMSHPRYGQFAAPLRVREI